MHQPDPSQTDDLTRLLNRGALLEKLPHALYRAKAENQEEPLSLALIDIDHFKSINDQYGHVTGDNMLVRAAEVLRSDAGEQALVGRYGGDEFLALFPGEEREAVFLKLEQIRQELGQQQVQAENGETINGIFISVGVASFPLDGRTENELLRKADHALYRAKASGRNQIRLAFEEKMVPKTTHYTPIQLERLSKLAEERGVSEADLLREAMDDFLTKYGVNDIET